ncbi:hypothetical protein HMI56_000337 [Coelomomyces lativittatus]|nr:hypothetical protein HMI56_000337 [Coelomomyces lativittatus]
MQHINMPDNIDELLNSVESYWHSSSESKKKPPLNLPLSRNLSKSVSMPPSIIFSKPYEANLPSRRVSTPKKPASNTYASKTLNQMNNVDQLVQENLDDLLVEFQVSNSSLGGGLSSQQYIPQLQCGPLQLPQCSRLRCRKCDFSLLTFNGYTWSNQVTYLTFRQFMPNSEELKKFLFVKKSTFYFKLPWFFMRLNNYFGCCCFFRSILFLN